MAYFITTEICKLEYSSYLPKEARRSLPCLDLDSLGKFPQRPRHRICTWSRGLCGEWVSARVSVFSERECHTCLLHSLTWFTRSFGHLYYLCEGSTLALLWNLPRKYVCSPCALSWCNYRKVPTLDCESLSSRVQGLYLIHLHDLETSSLIVQGLNPEAYCGLVGIWGVLPYQQERSGQNSTFLKHLWTSGVGQLCYQHSPRWLPPNPAQDHTCTVPSPRCTSWP